MIAPCLVAAAISLFSHLIVAAGSIPQDAPKRSYMHVCNHGVEQPCAEPAALLKGDSPPYTAAAHHAQVEGAILLDVVVDEKGQAREVIVVRGLGYGLDESAIKTIKRWKFKPGTYQGNPVVVMEAIQVTFHMQPRPY